MRRISRCVHKHIPQDMEGSASLGSQQTGHSEVLCGYTAYSQSSSFKEAPSPSQYALHSSIIMITNGKDNGGHGGDTSKTQT